VANANLPGLISSAALTFVYVRRACARTCAGHIPGDADYTLSWKRRKEAPVLSGRSSGDGERTASAIATDFATPLGQTTTLSL